MNIEKLYPGTRACAPVAPQNFVAGVAFCDPPPVAGLGKNRASPPPPSVSATSPTTPPTSLRVWVSPNRTFVRVSTAARLMANYWHQTGKNIKGSSVLGCGRWRAYCADPNHAQIQIDHNGPRFLGHFSCRAVWSCEHCSKARVAQTRSWLRAELIPAVESRGLMGSLITLTLAHSYEEDWQEVVARLFGAYTLMDRRMGKHYPSIGALGKLKALEAPVGVNGLHAHLHLLLIHAKDLDLEDFAETMKKAWAKAVAEVGGAVNDFGFDFKQNCLNDYTAKLETSHEMASHGTKTARQKGKLTSQLLDRAARGDHQAGEEWLRAQRALGGKMRFHAGNLPKKLGISCPSKWEDEAREAELEADRLAYPEPVVIEYPHYMHVHATQPSTGRAGLALILRSARTADKNKVMAMVNALRVAADRVQVARQASKSEMQRIMDAAAVRVLELVEVPVYLQAQALGFSSEPGG